MGLKKILDNLKPTFSEGGKLSAFGSLFDAAETFFFVPNETAKVRGAQIHDAIDSKRSIFFVVIALIPAILFGMYNIGYQHALVTVVARQMFVPVLMYGAISCMVLL